MAVVLAAATAFAACEPTPPPAVTQPPEPADVVPWPDTLTWTEADIAAPPAVPLVTEHMAAVAADASGFVSVGFRERGPQRDGAVWFSIDGRSWEVVGLPAAFEGVDLVDVTAGIGGFVAIGALLQEAGVTTVVYRSEDGRRWERTAIPGAANTYANSVAGGPGGYVLAGSASDGGPATWVSPDGRTWEQVARQAMGDGAPSVIDPQPDRDGWIALGTNASGPVVLRSSDGIAWTATPIEATPEAYATRLVAGRWGYLVRGGQASCGPLSSCPSETVTWWSGDGAAWTRLRPEGALESDVPILVEAGDHGLLALDGANGWSSATGWSWSPLPEPGDGSAGVNAVVVVGDVIVAVGDRYLEDGTSRGRIIVAE